MGSARSRHAADACSDTGSADCAERLLGWRVPDGVTMLDRHRVALYALSVGIGSNPVDPVTLRFTDPSRSDFSAFPAMALVLGYPGFWLGDEALGIGCANILHIEQGFDIVAPLPLEGRITGTTRITALVDRGAGRGSVLSSCREIVCERGSLLARVTQKHLLRGLDGFAPSPAARPAPASAPDGPPVSVSEYSTKPDQALLYRLNGDMNPLHADAELAAEAGFRAPILHGMCSFAIAAWAVARHHAPQDPARLRSASARFTAPVLPGETLQTKIYAGARFRTLIAERDEVALDFGRAIFAEPAAGDML